MKVPPISSLKLLVKSDQQLFVYLCEGIGLKCNRPLHTIGSDFNPILVESIALHMHELDDYRKSVINIAESHGFNVGIIEETINTELTIDENILTTIKKGFKKGLRWVWDSLGKPLYNIMQQVLSIMLTNALSSNRYSSGIIKNMPALVLAENLYAFCKVNPRRYDPRGYIIGALTPFLKASWARAQKAVDFASIPSIGNEEKRRFNEMIKRVYDHHLSESILNIPQNRLKDHLDYFLVIGVTESLKQTPSRQYASFINLLEKVSHELRKEISNKYKSDDQTDSN